MARDEFDAAFVPRPITGLIAVAIGSEMVLLDGWNAAVTLNATGQLIWSGLDGTTSIGDLTSDLAAATGGDLGVIGADVERFVTDLALRGLLDGVEPPSEGEPFDGDLGIIVAHEQGDVIDDITLTDLDGTEHRSLDLADDGDGDGTALLVNWNPHCGYCARISGDLADLAPRLAEAGCRIVLATVGTAEANRAVLEAAGLDVTALLLEPGVDLFRAAGTPSAYHLDGQGRIVSPPAYGSEEVPALAARLAGVQPSGEEDGTIRYLLDRDGLCAPAEGTDVVREWSSTSVHRFGDHHIGIRHGSPATADILDRLLPGTRVDDDRAGHSFSLALGASPDPTRDGPHDAVPGRGPRALSLLVQPGRPVLRSRDPRRAIRALLTRICEATTPADPALLRVDAIPVVHEGGAALLPAPLLGFEPRLQPLLAREGIAVVDTRWAHVDPETAELVVPEIGVAHDPSVLAQLPEPGPSRTEMPGIAPGRYPLTAWCTAELGDLGEFGARPLTPAEAAASTLSTVQDTPDPAARVRQLGCIFGQVRASALIYMSEPELIAAIGAALAHPDDEQRPVD